MQRRTETGDSQAEYSLVIQRNIRTSPFNVDMNSRTEHKLKQPGSVAFSVLTEHI